MYTPYSFDDLSNQNYAMPSQSIYQFDLDDDRNDKDVLLWLKAERDYLQNDSLDRIQVMRRNLALYKGIQYQEMETRIDARDRASDRTQFVRKVVANHLFDLTKNRASRLVKFRPAVAILPTNDELEDKLAAKACKMLLDHIWYEQDFEGVIQTKLATIAQVLGEVYLFVLWDKDKGDLHPAYVSEKKRKGRVPLLDENGQQVKDPQGNLVYVDSPVRIGDVVYKTMMPTDVLLQKKPSYQDVDYLFTMEVMGNDKLRLLYPKKAAEIKDQDVQVYDYEKMQEVSTKRESVVFTFWHKRTDQMDKGRKIVFTNDVLLESTEFPFSHDQLPCIRFTDQDLPGELHGVSFYEQIKGLTGTYNNLTNMLIRNAVMVSHPKWMVPAGSVALDRLGNDITIVQYKGPQPPVLANAQSIPSDLFAFRDKLKEEFQQISGVFGVSRGEPPPGIKAGVALQFLSEQESERYNELVLKWNEMIRQVAQITIAVAGDYYDQSDERMVRVLGKNNEYMTEFFKVSALEKDYDIRIQNSSALPKSVAARTQTLLDLSERFPDQFTGEQVIDMLDLAQSDKFIDAATVAVRSAEAENQKLYEVSDSEVLSPAEYENHIVHWRTHTRDMQEFRFKYKTAPEIQARFIDHVMAHEMFMMEQAKKSPTFAKQLEALPMFPMFYSEPVPPPAPPAMEAQGVPLPGAQAPQGQPVQQAPGLEAFQQVGMPISPLMGGEQQLPAIPPGVTNLESQLGGQMLPPIPPSRAT
jgi:hypothetical protein